MFTVYAIYAGSNLMEVEHTRSKAQALYALEEIAALGIPGWVLHHGSTVAHCQGGQGGQPGPRYLRTRLMESFREEMDRWVAETARRHGMSYREVEALALLATVGKEML